MLKFALNVMSRSVTRLFSASANVLNIFLIVFFLASHTVGWVADMTSAMFRQVAGVATTTALAKHELTQVRSQNLDLQRDLTAKSDLNSILSTELDDTRRTVRSLDTSLIHERQSSTVLSARLESAEADSVQARRQIAQLESHLTQSKSLVSSLGRTNSNLVALNGNQARLADIVEDTISSVSSRTKRVASANVAATFTESIPIYGIGFILAATAIELGAACQNMHDLYELQVAISPETALPFDRDEVCGLQVPTTEEISVALRNAPQTVFDNGASALQSTRSSLSWVKDIERGSLLEEKAEPD